MERKLLAMAIAGLTMSNAHAVTYQVTEDNDNGKGDTQGTLSYAIRMANDPNGQPGRANGSVGPDTIEFKSDINIVAPMLTLIDSDINIIGNGYTLSGGRLHRPLFIKSGQVQISDLIIEDGLAKGQNTYYGYSGAGAGLGGGLFIYDGHVEITDVVFRGNRAFGGTGGLSGDSNAVSRVGGGMQKTAPEGENRASLYADPNENYGTSFFGDGGYGHKHDDVTTHASGNYGGALTTAESPNGGFGAGGFSVEGNTPGGNGGFGSGGGFGYAYGSSDCGDGNDYACGTGGDGGFGGGGGYGGNIGGKGGFGAAGGGAYYSFTRQGGFGASSNYSDGAGMGGAVFVRAGQVTLKDVTFESNQAYGGAVHPDIVDSSQPPIDGPISERRLSTRAPLNPAAGYGGAVFVMHTLENANGNNQGMPTALPEVNLCNVTFAQDAEKANEAYSDYDGKSTDDMFDAGERVNDSTGNFMLPSGDSLQAQLKAGDRYDVTVPAVLCGAESLVWAISTQPQKGQATVTQLGELSYEANTDADGEDTLTVSITAGDVTKTVDLNLTIVGVGPVPVEPDTPDTPKNPDTPNNPDTPTNPDTPDTPEEGSGSSSSGGSLFWLLGGLLPWLRRRR